MSDSTLKELWQQVAEKKSCEAKQKELTSQRNTLADRLKKLEKSKLAEQADVDRLEGHSLAAFFYQVIGKMDEKLDKERQEAYAARVKYDAAFHDLSSVDADLAQIQNRLARLSDCERQYQAALSEKIKSIKVSAHPAAQQIAESESRIAALKVQKRELLEAINAGKTALHTVNEVLETLDNAEGWSTWDVMGGGLGVDLAKYAELDDAQEQIEQLQVELRRFKTELADVEITADLQVTVDSFLKFADFFFDGLFADWAVLDHINQAQSRVENTKGQIKRVLALLKKMREDVDVQIADEKEQKLEYYPLIRSFGSYPHADGIQIYPVRAGEELARDLAIEPGDDVICIKKRILADTTPVIYSIDYLPRALFGNRDSGCSGTFWIFCMPCGWTMTAPW